MTQRAIKMFLKAKVITCASDRMSPISRLQYWKSIKIWIKNSHVVNRRLCGVVHVANWKIILSDATIQNIVEKFTALTYEELHSKIYYEPLSSLFFPSDRIVTDITDEDFEDNLSQSIEDDGEVESVYVIIQKLLSRSPKYKETYRIVLLDVRECQSVFINVSEDTSKISLCPEFPYSLKFVTNEIILETIKAPEFDPSVTWLNEQLIPRINKWTVIEDTKNNGLPNGSLNLISINEYNILYQDLKTKYGQHFVEIWPETTDPSKFVFEDVAIATYLLLLWKREREISGVENKQSFIDLGCGNGLLVFILNSEGHPGSGVDIRKRGIWDLYPVSVKLTVEPVVPSDKCLFPDVDWLIGNHSDELTPWIPVFAARSSFNCRFFLLPCCAYEFNGTKYQRQNSSKSQYNEYLEYVQMICEKCGIHTDVDRLKIPSTKRVCLIGTHRLYAEDEYDKKLLELKEFIDEKNINKTIKDVDKPNELWVSDFKPRDPIERVRNCTKVEKGIINEIITSVSTNLLNQKNYLNSWNAGGCVPLCDIVKSISSNQLKLLKNECGGLQTLLKNNHHIFEVSSGNVKFRFPRTKSEFSSQTKMKKNNKRNKSTTYKPKSCWFHANHPDGCPLPAMECTYVHS